MIGRWRAAGGKSNNIRSCVYFRKMLDKEISYRWGQPPITVNRTGCGLNLMYIEYKRIGKNISSLFFAHKHLLTLQEL